MNDRKDLYTGDPEKAARVIILNPPESDAILSYEYLYTLGDFPVEPAEEGFEHYKAWELGKLTYKETLRDLVMKAPPEGLGRLLHTVRGEGFQLLTPGESIQKSETEAFDKVDKVFAKAQFRVKNADAQTQQERMAQTASRVRIGLARKGAQGARDSEKELEKIRSYSSDSSGPTDARLMNHHSDQE